MPQLSKLSSSLCLCGTLIFSTVHGSVALAQNSASAVSALSAMPIASVMGAASVAAGSVLLIPPMLLISGGTLILRSVEASARATVYVLERASDGSRVSIEVAGVSAVGASIVAGATVTTSVVAAGVILSVAGEVIAFIPNELGRSLLFSERLTK